MITAFVTIQRNWHRLSASEETYRETACLLHDSATAKEKQFGFIQPALSDSIEFQSVTFAYRDDEAVLCDASWILFAGQITALIGASGTGKSTIVDLLAGLRVPSGGKVLIDGVDLKSVDLTAWPHMIGYVPQEVTLFDGTVFDNVTMGRSGISDAEVEEALHRAGAMSFVESKPGGLRFLVGERGHRLSGGQRQRIAIARALVQHPALLILDEATTGLDPETERGICDVVKTITREADLTVLAISHHVAWADVADAVFTVASQSIVRQVESASTLADVSKATK